MKSICGLILLSACTSASVGGKDDGSGDTGSTETGDSAGCDSPSTWYRDSDGDGFGDASSSASACDAPEGTVADATDCDDGNALVYPGAPEVCNDGLFNDCDDAAGDIARDACPSDGPYPLSGSDALLIGEEADNLAGSRVGGVGDIDGDDRADLLIASPRDYVGVVYLVLGPVSGRVDLQNSDAQLSLSSSDSTGWTGWQAPVSGVGDMDGDALPDIAVGVPLLGSDDGGGAYLFAGTSRGALGPDDAIATLFAAASNGESGQSIAGLGDADGDGWDDVLVGAPGLDGLHVESDVGLCPLVDEDDGEEGGSEAGITYLVRGPVFGESNLSAAEAQFIGEDAGDLAGTSVASPGDLNGDGLADLLIGAIGNCAGGLGAGAAYIEYGPASGMHLLEDADGKVTGEGEFSYTGEGLTGAGDVNGDGTPDILVGAPDIDGPHGELQGKAYLVLGPALGFINVADAQATLSGEEPAAHAGRSLSSAGDIDRDGLDDLLVGVTGRDEERNSAGAAYVVMGPLTGSINLGSIDMKFIGQGDEYAGWSVAGVGDTNADGLPDLLIGIPGSNLGGTYAGAAALILGGGPAFTGTWGP